MSIKVRDILAKLKIEAKETTALDTEVHFSFIHSAGFSPDRDIEFTADAESISIRLLDDHGGYHDADEWGRLGQMGEPYQEVIVLE